MNRSNFAFTRLIVLPYSILLVLYLLVIGGGGAWLYFEVRAVETRLLVNEMMAAIQPLAEKLDEVDAIGSVREAEPWLADDLQGLFAEIPSLRKVSVHGLEVGYQLDGDANGEISSRVVSPLPRESRGDFSASEAAQRLHGETHPLFLIRFDLGEAANPQVRLDFAFDRAMLLARLDENLDSIERSILVFAAAGAVSILLALTITVVAMRTTRRLEGYFQEIYQLASVTEMAAQLVHDLRNPLAALRSNVKALLVSPQQTREIVEELDRDIVTLNDKLSAFLNLTRRRDDSFEPVDIRELISDAVRLAEPELRKHQLTVRTEFAPDLPRPAMQRASMRDALLNIIINAARSGQREGVVRVAAEMQDGDLRILVEDQGSGIPVQELPYLFDPFFTTRDDGNGLGLAIVQRIVSFHQGQVYAENRPDGGARFVVCLPLQRKETPHWWKKLKKNSPN